MSDNEYERAKNQYYASHESEITHELLEGHNVDSNTITDSAERVMKGRMEQQAQECHETANYIEDSSGNNK